ncbi:uncharacterized protein LOC143541447 [Bidens hawaiensis]|uniref:uncharacterized protein LOC143541447 n=1 Tax=Bidens hawaiensis TaxID=980011 RepID=UPI004049DE07
MEVQAVRDNNKNFLRGRMVILKDKMIQIPMGITEANHYFEIDETPERLKIRFAVINLDGPALQWHQSFVGSRGGSIRNMQWAEYVSSLSTRFAYPLKYDAIGALVSLKQTGSLQDLCQEFDLWLTRVSISEEYAISFLLRAVKPEIGYPVRILRPRSLLEAYLLARMQDESNQVINPPSHSRFSKPTVSNQVNASKGFHNPSTNKVSLLPTPAHNNKNYKKLTPKEYEEKRLSANDHDEEDLEEIVYEPPVMTP